MLNIGKLAAGGEAYYLATVASGVEDYYTGSGEAAGYWTGAASAGVGVTGEVDADDLRMVLGGAHPDSGAALGSFRSGRRVPGFDLAFRAPKSVSLLWAVAGQAAAEAVREAHDEAVDQALGYLEEHAAFSRRGAGGHESVGVRGFVAAAFRHRSSRAGDPLLHTHVLVSNIGQAVDDGVWRTLDARRLYTHAKTAGCLYQAALRSELTRRLGVEWNEVRNGVADVAGVPRDVIEAFSQRRAEILAHMAQRGESSARAAQAAALATRRTKDYGVRPEGLHDRWRTKAEDLGWGRRQAEGLLGAARATEPSREWVERMRREMGGPAGLTARSATFARRDVIQAWCQRLRHGGRVDEVVALADAVLEPQAGVAVQLLPATHDVDAQLNGEVDAVVEAAAAAAGGRGEELRASAAFRRSAAVILAATGEGASRVAARLLARELPSAEDAAAVLTWRAQRTASQADPDAAQRAARAVRGAVIRRADGRLVAGDPDERRWSTVGLLALEQRLVAGALDRVAGGVATAPDEHVDAALREAPGLSDEQAAMVRRLTGSGAGVEVVVGRAGSGKTFALAVARRAWQTAGVPVVGAALAARAAAELQEATGVPACTLDRLLADIGREHGRLVGDTVVVVDEAAMVGTRKLGRLLDHAHAVGAKVVLVGDHHQLPEIDAGGLFRALALRLPGVIELTQTRRQRHDWERQALAQLRCGSAGAAVDAYARQGRIHTHGRAEEARRQLVDDWWAARVAPEGDAAAVMIAAKVADVEDLNRRARQRLSATGRLGGAALAAGDREYRTGDEVVFLRNDRKAGLTNGMRAVVEHIDEAAGGLRVRAGEATIDVPAGYLTAGHLAHAYAITAHKAQGSTCERTFVLGSEGLYREWAYTALSRHRDQTHLYLTTEPEYSPEQHPQTLSDTRDTRQEPAAELTQQLNRSRAQRLASDLNSPPADPATPPSPAWSNGAEPPEDPSLAREDRRRQALLEERARAVDELHAAERRQPAAGEAPPSRRSLLRRSPRGRHPAVNQEPATAPAGAARWRTRIQEIDALLESSDNPRQFNPAAQNGSPQTVEEALGNHPGVGRATTEAEEGLGLDVA